MWPRWNKSSRGGSNAAADSVVTVTVTAKTPSLKDIQSLVLLQDQEAAAAAAAPNKSSSTIFHRVRVASTAIRTWKSAAAGGSSNRSIVLYYTSLRVVRKTFEDCRAVRSILRGFRVAIDERDLSMDASFLDELQGRKEHLSLPRLFVGGRYVGGADEVQMLHETGELKKIIEGAAVVGPGGTCEGCGGFRFVLCGSCSGSHKYFHSEEGAFLTCTACNENGLVRCPQC
ncbi:electron transporter [Iris pallida]|uniref:Electron transporter n=1 Tax=Iris pallida TaxID=29817 RepID=A0AAX6GIA9_IRIPA|nr:electron transporter [Iris pallida]